MRRTTLIALLVMSLLGGAFLLSACAPAKPSVEKPPVSELDAAIGTATTSVANASTLIFSIKQSIPGLPETNDDLEKLTSTLNAAAQQTGATQIATSQAALDQFIAGIAKIEDLQNQQTEGSSEYQQLQQLIDTLNVGRDALGAALP